MNTRFLEKYYQKLLTTPAVDSSKTRDSSQEYVGTGTIRDIHKLLRNCFEQAVKWELMKKNPAVHAIVPKHKQKTREIWTAETLMNALDLCNDESLKLALNLSFSLSLRIGELLALTWDCVDISEEAIENGRAKVVINKELQRVSKEAMRDLEEKDILFVFPEESKYSGCIVPYSSFLGFNQVCR